MSLIEKHLLPFVLEFRERLKSASRTSLNDSINFGAEFIFIRRLTGNKEGPNDNIVKDPILQQDLDDLIKELEKLAVDIKSHS